MKLAHRTVTLALREPFSISRSTDETVDSVFLEIEHDGLVGYGEASPQHHYGESVESATAFLAEAEALLGDDPFALDEIEARLASLAGEHAARAGVDMALHDLCGKIAGVPVWRLLGLRRAGPPTSWTIWLGDPDAMARRTERVGDRFKRLKLKLGAGDGLDVERVRAVRGVTELPVQVDVNEAWELDEAIENVQALGGLGVQYVEQPLPAGHDGGPRLKHESPVPIYVDEDVHTLQDVAAAAERAHGVNLKLAKSGGIREAVRMAYAAKALDLGVMLGCMVESSVGIAAAAQIGSLCDHVDLDGNLLLGEDPWTGVDFVDGVQVPSDQPGLGVHEALSRTG
jgi:L-alanine-DL-glutamate epimerase-like enolase superfamily enzyme